MKTNPDVVKGLALEMEIEAEDVKSGLFQFITEAITYFYETKIVQEAEETPVESSGDMIAKSMNEALRQATFVVLEPNIPDLQGDIYSEEEVRKACHNFVEFCQKAYIDHKVETADMKFVELYVAPTDLNINGTNIVKGTWLAVCQFNEELWQEVKADPLMGLSIGCYAKKEAL